MRFKNTVPLIILLFLSFLTKAQESKDKNEKHKVLNFATFHLSRSSDANSSPVDINNSVVKRDVDMVVEKLVDFNPTIICVEVPKEYSDGTNEIYQEYKVDQSKTTNWSEEINAIAFEVGRLSGVENIYGIDYQLGFDYPKLMQMAQDSESPVNTKFLENNANSLDEFNELSLLGKFEIMNTNEWRSETLNFYNFLSTIHTEENLEGVEIISDFYKRNLAIYSNFNDVPKGKDDRILIILGGAHSAFLDLYLENNSAIELVDLEKYVVK